MSKSSVLACVALLSVLGSAWALRDAPPHAAKRGRLHWIDAEPTTTAPEASEELLALGEALYEARCSICHGKYGEGNGIAAGYLHTPPRDFSYGVFKLKSVPYSDFPTDEDFFRTLTVGFPAYGMPSFAWMSEEERWALVHYAKQLSLEAFRLNLLWDGYDQLSYDPDDPELTDDEQAELEEEIAELESDVAETIAIWFEPGEPVDLGEPVAESPEVLARGEELFRGAWDCVSCHGESGRGDGPSALAGLKDDWDNPIQPRDYAAGRWYFKGGDRPQDIVRTLRCGLPGSPMPSFGSKPEETRDLWCVAHYVRSLARKGAEEGR